MQALYHTAELKDLVLGADPNSSQALLSSLQLVFHCLSQRSGSTLSPTEFLAVSRPAWFVAGEQQDCSEFLFSLFSGLEGETVRQLEDSAGHSLSVVREVFGGRLETSHECSDCRTVSSSTDWFTELLVPVLDEQETSPEPVVTLPDLAHLSGISVTVCREEPPEVRVL